MPDCCFEWQNKVDDCARALEAVQSLMLVGNSRDMHVVNPDHLATLLKMVSDRLRDIASH